MKEGASEAAVEPSKSYSAVGEKHAKRYAASDSRDSSYAAPGTFGQEGLPTEETTVEKSDRPKVEGQSQLQQKLPDSVAGVSSQHGVLLQGSQSNKLTSVQESMNAREMSAVPAHSMRMGKAVFNNTGSNLLGLMNFNRDFKNSCVARCHMVYALSHGLNVSRSTVSILREKEVYARLCLRERGSRF